MDSISQLTPPPVSGPRTRGALARAAAAAALAALGAGLAAGCVSLPHETRYEEQSRLSLDVAPQTRLLVDNERGTVRLQPSASPKLQIDARKWTAARSVEDARDLARRVQVEVLREGADLKVVVHYPERLARVRARIFGREWTRRRADVDLVIAVPGMLPVKVVTKSGDLTVEGTSGPLEYWTTSGDASLERHAGAVVVHSVSGDATVGRLDGPLEMSTTSGDLHADQVAGPLAFESTSGDLSAGEVGGDLAVSSVSGDVEVERVRGATRVSTTSGDVALRNAPGRVDVTTASGDLSAGIEPPLERVWVETTSGDVSLRLPDPPQGRLEVVTASGEVAARLPLTLEQASRRRLVGVMGPGPATVAIHTSSGDVQVGLAGDR